jgi:hypothetical protein
MRIYGYRMKTCRCHIKPYGCRINEINGWQKVIKARMEE